MHHSSSPEAAPRRPRTTRGRWRGTAAVVAALAGAALLPAAAGAAPTQFTPAPVAPAVVTAAPEAAPAPEATTASAVTAEGAAPESMRGEPIILRSRSTDATASIPARAVDPSRVGTVKSTFVVDYIGFPANAKASFQRAVDIWSTLVQSSVPIRIQATWEPLPSGVLGGAGASFYFRNFANAPKPSTWYPVALANARAGRDLAPGEFDIEASFASSGIPWYYGTNANPGASQMDLTSVVLHEIGHGLGFADSAGIDGSIGYFGFGNPINAVAYDRLVQNTSGTSMINVTNDSTTLSSYLRGNNLVWVGGKGVAGNNGVKPKLYAPNPFESGSSIAHFDENTFPPGNPNSLMTPYLDDGEGIHDPGNAGLGVLGDLGWVTADFKGPPSAPTVTLASAGTGRVVLNWRAPSNLGRQNLTQYRVVRYNGTSSTIAQTYTFGPTTTTATITGLTNGTAYRFGVIGVNASGPGPRSGLTELIRPLNTAPFNVIDSLINRQYLDFHGRAASAGEVSLWRTRVHAGELNAKQTVAGIAKLPGSYDPVARLTRLYSAYFKRLPDYGGFTYWVGKMRTGTPLAKVSDTFAASSEFQNTYGSLSNTAFVNLVYQNVLGRAPDSAGRTFWVGQLNAGKKTRGAVMTNFSESSENVTKMDSEVYSVLYRTGMLRRIPPPAEYFADINYLDGAAVPADLAGNILVSAPYAARF